VIELSAPGSDAHVVVGSKRRPPSIPAAIIGRATTAGLAMGTLIGAVVGTALVPILGTVIGSGFGAFTGIVLGFLNGLGLAAVAMLAGSRRTARLTAATICVVVSMLVVRPWAYAQFSLAEMMALVGLLALGGLGATVASWAAFGADPRRTDTVRIKRWRTIRCLLACAGCCSMPLACVVLASLLAPI
jgi:hypothetical protein